VQHALRQLTLVAVARRPSNARVADANAAPRMGCLIWARARPGPAGPRAGSSFSAGAHRWMWAWPSAGELQGEPFQIPAQRRAHKSR